jgi:adenylate cyclase class 2
MSEPAHETEAKIKVPDFGPVREALARSGAEHRGTFVQTDTYFDSPRSHLLEGGRGLRLRQFEHVDGDVEPDVRPLLTYKGPVDAASRFKRREETQTHLDSPGQMCRILEILGVEPVAILQKRRSSYRLGACLVELDELPALGCFVEIEGPDESAIDEVCRALGLTGEHIHASYLSLAGNDARDAEGTCRRLVFDDHA